MVFVFIFSWAKPIKNENVCSVYGKNMSFLALNIFLAQNRLKMGLSNLNVLQKDWVFRLGSKGFHFSDLAHSGTNSITKAP